MLAAPAGYGKTNAVAQWASATSGPSRGSRSTKTTTDPVSLCRHLTEALARVEAVDQSILDSLASGRRSPAAALRILMSALSSLARPLVLVLDDVHVLRSRECSHVLAVLAERFPDGSTLVLAGRASPRIPARAYGWQDGSRRSARRTRAEQARDRHADAPSWRRLRGGGAR